MIKLWSTTVWACRREDPRRVAALLAVAALPSGVSAGTEW